MIKLVEWIFLIIAPAAGAILLTIGMILHFTGQLGLVIHHLVPSRRIGRRL